MDATEITIEVDKKYVNRNGDLVKIINCIKERHFKPVFVAKLLKNGVQYTVDDKGIFKGVGSSNGYDIVDVYTLTPNKDHMVLLRVLYDMRKNAFDGRFFDKLMQTKDSPTTLHQAESKMKDLIEGGLVTTVDGRKLTIYQLTAKALALFDNKDVGHVKVNS